MFGESESESPRVPSPWDSLISIPPSPALVPAPSPSPKPHPLSLSHIPRLVPEADSGNVEYKLQLLSPSPARFARLVTQLKWRLLEGGGQAYYELGVADSGALVGLHRRELEMSLETLECMAGEIGASVVVVKEIEVPPEMARVAARETEGWGGRRRRRRKGRVEVGVAGKGEEEEEVYAWSSASASVATETETETETEQSSTTTTTDFDDEDMEDMASTVVLDRVTRPATHITTTTLSDTDPAENADAEPDEDASPFPTASLSIISSPLPTTIRPQPCFSIDLEIASVFKPRPMRARMQNHMHAHVVGPPKTKRLKKIRHITHPGEVGVGDGCTVANGNGNGHANGSGLGYANGNGHTYPNGNGDEDEGANRKGQGKTRSHAHPQPQPHALAHLNGNGHGHASSSPGSRRDVRERKREEKRGALVSAASAAISAAAAAATTATGSATATTAIGAAATLLYTSTTSTVSTLSSSSSSIASFAVLVEEGKLLVDEEEQEILVVEEEEILVEEEEEEEEILVKEEEEEILVEEEELLVERLEGMHVHLQGDGDEDRAFLTGAGVEEVFLTGAEEVDGGDTGEGELFFTGDVGEGLLTGDTGEGAAGTGDAAAEEEEDDDDDDVFVSPSMKTGFGKMKVDGGGDGGKGGDEQGGGEQGGGEAGKGQGQGQGRLIVEVLVVRKMSVDEAFLDFGGFALI